MPGVAADANRIVGRYVLHDEIAAGGMATVHLGRLVAPGGFSRTVAIKRLHPHLASDPEFVSMFLDEARIASRIRHPNVASILDVVAKDHEVFLVMDYVQGESLAHVVRHARAAGAEIPVWVSIAAIAGALHGLHAAHDATGDHDEPLHIVHRDVSPQNIMLGADGLPRVLDFGVAKAVGRLQTTRDGQVKGKAAYMAPEQLRGGRIDRRCDVYAASIVLWELLAGRRLFAADSPEASMLMVLEHDVEPPSRFSKEPLPSALDEIVMRGLARDAVDRFPTAREMALALERVAPLATATQLGDWVRSMAHESLRCRAAQVSKLDNASSDDSLEPTRSQVSTISVARPLDPRDRASRGGWRYAATAAGAIAAVGGVVFVLVARRAPAVVPASSAAPTEAPIPAAPPLPVLPPPSEADPVPQPTPAPMASRRPSTKSGAGRAAAVAPAAPRPPPRCDPPFTVNADGYHVPKPECVK